jgi:3-oxoacyl-[acyl-carrier protein] reductase
MLLQGKKALITGGSGGIGAALVRAFVHHGARVVFTYRQSGSAADELVSELGTSAVLSIHCDGSQSEQVTACMTEAIAFLGGLDILVNNAGITKDTLLLRMSEEDWDMVLDTNLKSSFLFCKQALRHMMRTSGSIINIGSVVGLTGNAGQANYAASKAGLVGFSKSIAREMGSKNIRCNVLAPGFIDTAMTSRLPENMLQQQLQSIPAKRIGQAQEVADVAVFLASNMASYINGQVISVCGGLNT